MCWRRCFLRGTGGRTPAGDVLDRGSHVARSERLLRRTARARPPRGGRVTPAGATAKSVLEGAGVRVVGGSRGAGRWVARPAVARPTSTRCASDVDVLAPAEVRAVGAAARVPARFAVTSSSTCSPAAAPSASSARAAPTPVRSSRTRARCATGATRQSSSVSVSL